jgi:hypothetical protein
LRFSGEIEMLDKTKKAAATTDGDKPQTLVISPPNFQIAKLRIVGTSPYVMNKMSSENRQKMMDKQMSGERAKKGAKREPKDFNKVFNGAQHISTDGWLGIPASSLRAAMISACRLVGFQMTRAKLCVFVDQDGIDADDGQPLVKIIGKPERKDMAVKLADGSTDIISRPFFHPWSAVVTVRWDGDQFAAADVVNLLARAGQQVGIGAGRPDSKASTGMGWGLFRVES